jgi:hypothetical protein
LEHPKAESAQTDQHVMLGLLGRDDPPDGEEPIMSVRCSRVTIGDGELPDTIALLFHFGDAAIGIPMKVEDARAFGRVLMTQTAGGKPQ